MLEPVSPRVYHQVLIPGAHSFHISLYVRMHVWLFVFVYAQTYSFIFLHAYSLLFSSSFLSLLCIHSLLLRPCSVHAPTALPRLFFLFLRVQGRYTRQRVAIDWPKKAHVEQVLSTCRFIFLPMGTL